MSPDSTSTNKVGVLISTVADNAGIDSTKAGLAEVATAAKTTSATATSAFDSFNKSLATVGSQMSTVGRSMSTGLTVPIVAVAGAAVKMAMDFQQSMTYVRTDAGDTTDNITTLSNSVLNLAKTSQFSPDVLANGLYHLASLGLRGADAMNALNTAQQMAAVGGADLESTASALGGALVSGISGVQNYTQAAGVLDATVGAGNMRMQDLVDAIGTGVLPVFKNAGLSITDFGAALATLTDNGQDAAAAATHLRMTVSLMEAPSQAAAKAMSDIGLTSNQLGLDMQTKGLIPALQDLQKHLLDTYGTTAQGKTQMAAALDEMFGGGKSSAAIQTLLDQLSRVQTKETQISQQSGEFSTKYNEQQQTASAQFKTAWDGIQANLIQLGDKIMPSVASAMKSVSGAISDLSGWFQGLSKNQQQFVIDAAGILAVMGPVLLVFGGLAKSVSSIVTLGGTMWDGISKVPSGVSSLFQLFGNIGTGAGNAASSFGGMVGSWATSIGSMTKTAALGAVDMGKSAATTAAGWAVAGANMIKDSAVAVASMTVDATKTAGAWILAAHNSDIGLGGTLIKMGVDSTKMAAGFVKDSVVSSVAWVKSALVTSVAWVASATKSAVAWTVTELPKIVAGFVLTGASAVKNALIASAAWVKNAAVASAAWVVQLAKVVASIVATSVVTVVQGAIQAAVWVANTVKVVAYAVAIDAAKTSTYLLGGATVATGALMAGVFAGLVIDIGLIYAAFQSVTGAINAWNNTQQAATVDAAGQQAAESSIIASYKSGKISQAEEQKLLTGIAQPAHASGTSYAPGGRTLVGEQGPEFVDMPRGSKVYPARQTSNMTNSGSNTFHFGDIHLEGATVAAVNSFKTFVKKLDSDGLLASKGMSMRRV